MGTPAHSVRLHSSPELLFILLKSHLVPFLPLVDERLPEQAWD